jgi:hypothetical protein
MESKAEITTAKAVRRILTLPPDDVPTASDNIFNGLEYFLPQVLSEIYDYWKHESFDGFFPAEFQRIGPNSVQLLGLGILISDQTVTPVHLRMGISPTEDKIQWMECRVGARGEGNGGMDRVPYSRWPKQLTVLPTAIDKIDWVYKITFGHQAISPT